MKITWFYFQNDIKPMNESNNYLVYKVDFNFDCLKIV